jgi:hypothetical protein
MVIGLGLSMFGPSERPVFEAEDPVMRIASPDWAKLLVACNILAAVEPLK